MKINCIEAPIDAVVAIIMTITALEIKVPETDGFKGILKEIPCFISFTISFLYICTAWYNHHYILAKSKWSSKRAFWVNNFWLLCMALTPVATTWMSEFPGSVTPEYSYFSCYILWAAVHYLLNVIVTSDNDKQAKPNKSTMNTRLINKHVYIDISLLVTGLIGIKYYPLLGLILLACQIVMWIIFTPKDSDKLTLLN